MLPSAVAPTAFFFYSEAAIDAPVAVVVAEGFCRGLYGLEVFFCLRTSKTVRSPAANIGACVGVGAAFTLAAYLHDDAAVSACLCAVDALPLPLRYGFWIRICRR